MATFNTEGADQGLRECLKHCPADLIEHMTNSRADGGLGFEFTTDFFHSVTAEKYETELVALRDSVPSLKRDGRCLARLRAAWCAARDALALKAKGLTPAEQDMEADHPKETVDDMRKSFFPGQVRRHPGCMHGLALSCGVVRRVDLVDANMVVL